MLRLGTVRTGFILGISIILAAIVYFFAANWGGMERISRTALSGALVVLLYGASYGVSRIQAMRGHHLFLAAVLLLGGCIAFGASVALLGQIYNSHADSYGLFLIWAFAALLLSLLTRYHPFYVLTYLLGHIALWQYFYPTNLSSNYSEGTMLFIGGLFALINLILLILTEQRLLASAPIRLLSFLVFQISLLWMSNSLVFEHYGIMMNIVSIAAIAAAFYYYMRIHLDKIYLTLSALLASAFAVLKFIELVVDYASVAFFFYGLVFVAILLTGNIMFFRRLGKLDSPHDSAHDTASTGQAETPPLSQPSTPSHRHRGSLIAVVVSAAITGLGAVIGSASILGLVMMTTESADPFYILYAIGIALVLPMLALSRIEETIRYTLLAIGFILGIIAEAFIDSFVPDITFIVLSAVGLVLLQRPIPRYVMYGLLNLYSYICLFHLFDAQRWSIASALLILLVINLAVYVLQQRKAASNQPIQTAGFFFTLLYLLCLTFFDDIFTYSYALFNIANFVMVTLLLFWIIRKHREVEAVICAVFWFVFIGFKYYDLLWSLLHKSITLALLGSIILTITYWYARRMNSKITEKALADTPSYWDTKPLLLVIAIILQLGFIGYQAASSEHALRSGTPIKLQFAPVDPRSMLQGDYVTLSYTISTLPANQTLLNDQGHARNVKVILKPDANDIYQFARIYQKDDYIEPNEVILNGRWDGYQRVYYGIETYFVPEGTGADVERDARFAYVRVSSSGNAILERLSDQ
jgi:uncharacterized membrane-anchored protein/uncharacterized membrane protein